MKQPLEHRQAAKAGNLPGFQRWALAGLIIVALGVFAAANIHLVYVSFESEPDCVDHRKAADPVPGAYRAAKSAC